MAVGTRYSGLIWVLVPIFHISIVGYGLFIELWESSLEGVTVVKVHFGEKLLDLIENRHQLWCIYVLVYNFQDGSELLIFLFKSKLLVHA